MNSGHQQTIDLELQDLLRGEPGFVIEPLRKRPKRPSLIRGCRKQPGNGIVAVKMPLAELQLLGGPIRLGNYCQQESVGKEVTDWRSRKTSCLMTLLAHKS